jgi:ABC-type amino acid transport system permease subunit
MPWILISILIALILLVLAVIWAKKNNKRPTDYYTFFIIGLIWTVFGIPLKNYALSGMGVVFLVVGLVNKDKWEKNRVKWSDLTEEERKIRTWLIIVLGIFLLAGFIAWYYYNSLIIG